MRTRALLALLLAALPTMLCGQTSPNPAHAKPSPKMIAKLSPEAVHRSAIVIDTHADTTQRFVDENFDLGDPLKGGNLNLDSIHKGNLGAEFFSIWVEPALYKGQYARRTLVLIDAVRQQVAKHPDQIMFVASPEGIESAHREHKFAALMGIEGGHSIENSLALLRQYYALGVRYMTLTWSNSTDWADSSGDYTDTSIPHTKEGLSEFGKDVVYEMNRLGMMVDISHVADKTFFRTLVITRAPVIASHSSARALCDAPRNMTDDMLRAVANSGGPNSKGGVVQVNFYSAFLSQAYRDAQKAQKPEVDKAVQALKDKAKAEGKEVTYEEISKVQREYADRIPRPPLSVLIDHIDHIAKVAGVDHVGLGSDFDGVDGQLPAGMDSTADLPKITAALMERGYSAEDCRKILGGNLLRVFREVEQVAKQLQTEDRPRITNKQPFDK
jgi:membrane dipeptidase